MRVKLLSTTCVAVVLATGTLISHAADANSDQQWRPAPPPTNRYWQAPNWSGFTTPPNYQSARPAYRPPVPPAYRAPRAPDDYPPMNRYQQRPNRTPPPPVQNTNRDYPPPPGPYRGSSNYGPNRGASAFNTPGYNPYRRNNNNRWNNNKFWGRSGPSTWMSPNKNNWERGWDDMINSPSRMGEMPGGWTAPEVTMPNPVDMGDQMQDNVKDLPDQIKNMDVGNEVD